MLNQKRTFVEWDDTQSAYITGILAKTGRVEAYSWAILDNEGTASKIASDEDGAYYIAALMTIKIFSVMSEQVLILQRRQPEE